MRPLILVLLALFALTGPTAFAQSKATDYLNIPGPISFNQTTFHLAWSSNPNPSYFKQEYIPAGESAEKFNQMVLLEVVTGNLTTLDAVRAQVMLLEERKKKDAVAQYQVFDRDGSEEIILDFMLSAGSKDALSVVEWSGYRYTPFIDKDGKKGVLLFAISKRGYGKDINDFFSNLKANRMDWINVLGALSVPQARIQNTN
ncbi:hypothetical protein [Rufibacter soli]|jgi:hypothetical protein